MRLASFLLFLALLQAQAKPAAAQADVEAPSIGALPSFQVVVESTCTKESKTCKALFKKEDLPKGKECVASPAGGPKWASPRGGPKWKVPESVPKEDQKEAKALAEKANKGGMKGLCSTTVAGDMY